MTELVLVRYDGQEPPSLKRTDAASAAALFKVLQGGPGTYIAVYETENVEAVEAAVAGNGGTPERYREIFAAPDARPISESNRHVFAIRIALAPDIDLDAFNEWYNGTHVPEVAPAGLQRGRRFESELPELPYMAIYDMAARDTLESEALARVRGFAQFTPQVPTLERTVLERIDPPAD